MERGSFTGDFEKKVRLCLIGDLLLGTREIRKRRLWKWASLSLQELHWRTWMGARLPGTAGDGRR